MSIARPHGGQWSDRHGHAWVFSQGRVIVALLGPDWESEPTGWYRLRLIIGAYRWTLPLWWSPR